MNRLLKILCLTMTLGGIHAPAFSETCKGSISKLSKQQLEALDSKLFRAYTDFYRQNFRAPIASELAELSGESRSKVGQWIKSQSNLLERFQEEKNQVWEAIRQRVAKKFLVLSLERSITPNEQQMADALGVDLKVYRDLFGKDRLFDDIEDLKSLAETRAPSKFRAVKDGDIFDAQYDTDTLEMVRKSKALILTSVVAGFPVNKSALGALIKLAEEKDAVILIRAINGEMNALKDEELQHKRIRLVSSDSLHLTPEFNFSNYSPVAKMKDPLEGSDTIGPVYQNLLFAAAKFRARFTARPENRYKSVGQYTTATISESNYQGSKVIQKRMDKKASSEDRLGHRMGAIFMEQTSGDGRLLGGPKTVDYHVTQLEFLPEFGGVFHVNKFYTAKKVIELRPAALVLGDSHIPISDPHLLDRLEGFLREARPRKIRLDDVIDAGEISHWDNGKLVTLARKAKVGRRDLRQALSQVVAFINSLHRIDPDLEIVINPANHNNWVYQYLNQQDYLNDPHNAILGFELAKVMAMGMDPVKYALFNGAKPFISRDSKTEHTHGETLLEAGLDFPQKVRFLEPGESWKEGPTDPDLSYLRVELGFHGHEGKNGRKSITAKEIATNFGRGVTGHTHATEIFNGGVVAGTSTRKTKDYGQDGFGNWTQTLVLVSPYGQQQVLQFKDGEWFRGSNANSQDQKVESVFPANYPRWVPDQVDGSSEGQVDQYDNLDRSK